LIIDERGVFLTQGNFALVYVSLETAQRLAGQPGAANDVVVRVASGTPVNTVQREITAAMRARFPDVGVTVTDRRGDPSYRQLYDSIPRHQRLFGIFAILVLAAAAFVAFNFTGRLVAAQRREIGVGMALGVPPTRLAIRPLLVAAQLALLGVLLGIGVGVIMSAAMASILRELTPLPEWHFPIQFGLYAQGAALAFAVPIAAALFPVWRAVRVTPVQAIRTDVGATTASGHAPLLARLPLPGRTTARLPVRNLLRVPWRTLMTAAGIAVTITILVGLAGLIDSFYATANIAEAEARRGSPDQIEITLDSFYPVDSAPVRSIRDSRLLQHVELAVQAPGAVRHGRTSFDVLLELRDLTATRWAPTIEQRRTVKTPAIVLTETAAQQLGVGAGDTVTVRYPRRESQTSYRFTESTVPVLGTNPFPGRGVAYLDISAASLGRVQGLTNLFVVTPARGVSVDDVKRSLFGQPAVASVQPVVGSVQTVRAQLDRVFAALYVVEGAVLVLALLIAYSAARINADERAREDATMLAFGLRLRTVVRMGVVEGLVIGVLGTVLGLGSGLLLLEWLVHVLLRQTIPDIGIVVHLGFATVLIALALGVAAVAAAPLLNALKLRRMNLPGALRIVE
jgi:putative ABC transport system permease protein